MTLFHTFTEDFTGTSLDTARWQTSLTNATVTQNDQLEINANATTGQRQAQVDLKSAHYKQFNNSYVKVRVITPFATGVFTRFVVRSISLGTQVQIDVTDGLLKGRNTQTGSEVTTSMGTYDPSAHAWWRLRHDGSTVIAGVSADGVTWTETSLGSYTAPASDDAFIRFWYSDSLSGSLASTAYFDKFNLPVDGGAISTLSGDFSSTHWAIGSGCAADTADSRRLNLFASGSSASTDTATAGWDLTASSFRWKNHFIPPSTLLTGPAADLSVEIKDNGVNNTGYTITRTAAGLWQFFKGGSAVGSTFTDLSVRQNPWMRIREASGTTYMEYSPDGLTGWAQPTSNQNTTNYSSITNLKIRIRVSGVEDAGEWSIQEVNGTPSPTISNDPTVFYMQGSVTASNAALNTSPTAPTVSSGHLSLLVVSMKSSTAGVAPTSSTPSGWTILCPLEGNGTLVAGSETGSNWIIVYKREDSGYGNPTISTTGVDSMASAILVFHSSKVTAGGSWDLTEKTKGSDTASGANVSITGDAGIGAAAGDLILSVIGTSGDSGVSSAFTLAGMSGATLLQNNTPINRTVTTGTDSRTVTVYNYVIAGSSSSAPTFAYTNSSATTSHGVFIRLRDVLPPLTTPLPVERAGASDSLIVDNAKAVTDTAGATDAIVFTATRVIAVTDFAGATEVVSLQLPPKNIDIDADDTAGATDSAVFDKGKIFSDSSTNTDTVACSIDTIASDVAGATDAAALSASTPVTDSSEGTDQAIFSTDAPVSDSAGATDTAILELEKAFTDESGSAEDILLDLEVPALEISDTSDVTDAVEFIVEQTIAFSDTADVSDELSFISELTKLLDEDAGSSDSMHIMSDQPINVVEAAGSTDMQAFEYGRFSVEDCGSSDSVQLMRNTLVLVSEDSGSSEVLWLELNVG